MSIISSQFVDFIIDITQIVVYNIEHPQIVDYMEQEYK